MPKAPRHSPETPQGESIKAVNIRLPKDIIHLLDLLITQGLYSSRSEAVRDFARDFAFAHAPPTAPSSNASVSLASAASSESAGHRS